MPTVESDNVITGCGFLKKMEVFGRDWSVILTVSCSVNMSLVELCSHFFSIEYRLVRIFRLYAALYQPSEVTVEVDNTILDG